MIIVKLQKILDKEERNLNWVASKTGIAYTTLAKFNKGKTTSVSYDVLDKLCDLFKCDICDLIEHIKE